MYNCQQRGCGKTTQPGEKIHRVVVQTQPRKYTKINEKGKQEVSNGFEIVKEIGVCTFCFFMHHQSPVEFGGTG